MSWMTRQRITSFFVVALLTIVHGEAAGEEVGDAKSAAKLVAGPDFELLGLDGELHGLRDARGKVLLVNFWATWCTSCRSEIPALNDLFQEFKNEGVEFYGIAVDVEGAEKVLPYLEETPIGYTVLLDPEAISTSIFGGLEGYPSTFVFDREGLIYSSYLGAQTEETFRDDIRYLLEAEPSAGKQLTGEH